MYQFSELKARNEATYQTIFALKKKVDTYYEYVQFKRAKFDCIGTEYDQDTGRILKMNFKFTGKFE